MVVVATAGLVAAAEPSMAATSTAANSFTQTNLIANTAAAGAKFTDPNLINAWGLAAGPNSPLWVSDNNSGFATVYSGGVKGSAVTLDLTVPVPGNNPTGQVFNSSTSFPVGGASGNPAVFIIDSDSVGSTQSPGEIAAWNGGAAFTVEDNAAGAVGGKIPAGAVFKGLAIATTPTAGPELFATDVANGKVDIFNKSFASIRRPKEFQDPALPAGYVPFGIQNLQNKIYVTYGKQNAAKTDVLRGKGLGYVDVYSVNGRLLHHLVNGGAGSKLNAPWGLAIGPKGFGPFAGDLLVGNLGNGWINAFNPTTGAFLGSLDGPLGAAYPIAINGLWGIKAGSSAFGGTGSLIFSAGPAGYDKGLVGILTPTS
ncbi:MAG TPA: TIGR03118 family protein [Streptosporangiaceae bacterium]